MWNPSVVFAFFVSASYSYTVSLFQSNPGVQIPTTNDESLQMPVNRLFQWEVETYCSWGAWATPGNSTRKHHAFLSRFLLCVCICHLPTECRCVGGDECASSATRQCTTPLTLFPFPQFPLTDVRHFSITPARAALPSYVFIVPYTKKGQFYSNSSGQKVGFKWSK